MTENELKAKYIQAYRIIRAERKQRASVFRNDPVKLNAKLVEIDMLLSILTEFKDELKAHLSSGVEQMQLIDPPRQKGPGMSERIYYTPARILALGTGSGKTTTQFVLGNAPFKTGGIDLTIARFVAKPPGVGGDTIELQTEIDTLRARIAELEAAALPALAWIDDIYPPSVFDGSSGDPGPVQIVAIRENLRRALAERQGATP